MPHRLKFDRAEARRLRAEGQSLRKIARRFGVTETAIFLGLKYTSPHQDWVRSLSPEALADYRLFVRKHYSFEEARRAVSAISKS